MPLGSGAPVPTANEGIEWTRVEWAEFNAANDLRHRRRSRREPSDRVRDFKTIADFRADNRAEIRPFLK